MPLTKFLTLLLALPWMMLPATLQADDTTYLHDAALLGGGGGGPFRADCPNGWALTGVNVTIGIDMNSVSPVCSPTFAGLSYEGTTHLGTYGDAKDHSGYASCAPNLMQGMDVGTSHANIVHHLQLVCLTPDGGTYIAIIQKADNSGPLTHGGADQRNERTGCPPGEFAVGLYGRAGAYVDAVGILCGKVAAAPRAPPPVQQTAEPPPNVRETPLPLGGDGNAGNGNNPAGEAEQSGAANTATTIYDQPGGNDQAYLEAGDAVTIVQCGDPYGWCQISQPTTGWVWGAELDR